MDIQNIFTYVILISISSFLPLLLLQCLLSLAPLKFTIHCEFMMKDEA